VSDATDSNIDDDSFDASVAQLTAGWEARGIDPATLVFVKGTAVARSHRRPATATSELRNLPALLTSGSHGAQPLFSLGDVLGEGAMGVVRLATQNSLQRQVATKSLKDDAVVDADDGATQLMLEGRITGALEHPNIVPVYALGHDEKSRPLLVMKRIFGRSWASLLDEFKGDRNSDPFLRRQLNVLQQVAQAVHYAHTKGIIHRDLKPDNVMIGEFGDVYVVDWGIAVANAANDMPGLTRAADVDNIEGTPAYMAPEMAVGDGEQIDACTDVYLLGAILHEILTGEPPHDGRTLYAVLTSAFVSKPTRFPATTPSGLVDIVHRATARFNAERYATAADFIQAIDTFLECRASTLLSDEASVCLELIHERLGSSTSDEERRTERLYAAFSECRFGYRQALRSWSDNDEARRGLQEVLELMIAFELARDAAAAAAAVARELPEPRPELSARIAAALERQQGAQRRLDELEREADLSIGHGQRVAMLLVGAILWASACVVCGFVSRYGIYRIDQFDFALVNFALALFILVGVTAARRHLLASAATRKLALTSNFVLVAQGGLWILASHFQFAMVPTAALHSLVGVALWSVLSFNIDRQWLAIAAGSAGALIGILLLPHYYFEWLGLCGAIGSAITVVVTCNAQVSAAAAASSQR
jgi:serine/threonine-protein kinase